MRKVLCKKTKLFKFGYWRIRCSCSFFEQLEESHMQGRHHYSWKFEAKQNCRQARSSINYEECWIQKLQREQLICDIYWIVSVWLLCKVISERWAVVERHANCSIPWLKSGSFRLFPCKIIRYTGDRQYFGPFVLLLSQIEYYHPSWINQ